MKKLHSLLPAFLTMVLLISGCASSQPDHVIYDKHYKHRIGKIVPETRGRVVHVHVHHHGKLTKKEKRFLRKMYNRKYKKNRYQVNVVFVYG